MKLEAKGEPLLPVGVISIPAFSVCEISIASKNDAAAQGGSSVKISMVRVAGFSLHSLTSDLQFLSSSLGSAREDQLMFRESSPCLAKDLDVKVRHFICIHLVDLLTQLTQVVFQDIPYWIPVSRSAILDDSADTVKLLNYGDPALPHAEIPNDMLLAYTNCTRQDWAISLLEMAIAAGALSVLVFTNDYWKQGPRCLPIVDTEVSFRLFPVIWTFLFNI